MIVELRIYHYLPGRLPVLLERFRSTTLDYFAQYSIEQIGFWTTQVGESNHTLTYLLRWESMAERVAQELRGKSANLLLDDVDLADAVTRGVAGCFTNSGQSCSIPTRMLVPRPWLTQAVEIAGRDAGYRYGPTDDLRPQLGPLVNRAQYQRVQQLIEKGIEEGVTLVAGGLGKPEGITTGYYVRPTIFSDVTPGMTLAREEIFGPVLSIMPYDTEEDATTIANRSEYGRGISIGHAG